MGPSADLSYSDGNKAKEVSMKLTRMSVWLLALTGLLICIAFAIKWRPSEAIQSPEDRSEPSNNPIHPSQHARTPREAIRSLGVGNITSIWANTGEDKITQDQLKASTDPKSAINSVWDSKQISIFGAKNEVVSFCLILEASQEMARDVQIRFASLTSPKTDPITSEWTKDDGVFDWTKRNIELFYVRYLKIQGLSLLAYENYYDERHVPKRLRRPWTGNGKPNPGTKWTDRPDADKYYPDIAVPLELMPRFDIAARTNQSIWVDVYIPKSAQAAIYRGEVLVQEGKTSKLTIPVELRVRNFSLPDVPNSKTMLFLGYGDINQRYLGVRWPNDGTPEANAARKILDRHFLLAHRHRISLIDSNGGPEPWSQDAPRQSWQARLDGSLFISNHGYAGPGVGVSNGIFSIGTYGSWDWQKGTERDMHLHADNWVSWFKNHAPLVEYFLFLLDEPPREQFPSVQQWATWIKSNPAEGKNLLSFATVSMPQAKVSMPALDIPCSCANFGIESEWDAAVSHYRSGNRRAWVYGTRRPATGSIAIEDDGVAFRQIAWAQYKKKIGRWFIWESTYYYNYQCPNAVETNVFEHAQTFGCDERFDPVVGRTGWNYTNGDGVLFYPGTDKIYPQDSYGVLGPLASLRLKHWRRGIQDADYLTLAAAVNPKSVEDIVNRIVPKVLWELGVDNPGDPTYVHADISWPSDPEVWEKARLQLADLIENKTPSQ